MQNTLLRIILIFLLFVGITVRADEKLPVLKVQDQVYSNVTVTAVTATDIHFSHSKGIANAKLKNLSAELQKQFNYDPVKAAQAEKAQAQGNASYQRDLLSRKPATPAPDTERGAASNAAVKGEDFVAPRLSARSVRGQRAPYFAVEKWLTAAPNTAGKFVLVDFWATWCGPCRASIPELNRLQAKFKDRLVIIGVSDETEAAVRKMTSPRMNYAVAIDTQERMSKALEIKGIPHCILIDPKGIVRFEGHPGYLNDARLEHFLAKYEN